MIRNYKEKQNTINYWFFPMRYTNTDIIIKSVLNHFKTTIKDLKSDSKKKDIVSARTAITSMLYYHTKVAYIEKELTLTDIGKYVNKDHSMVIHYLKTVYGWLKTDQHFSTKLKNACNDTGIIYNEMVDFLKTYSDKKKYTRSF